MVEKEKEKENEKEAIDVGHLPSSLFDYALPPELIAQTPAAKREQSRLLVVDRAARRVAHRSFSDLPSLLGPNDILFRNDARVLPARLFGKRPTGAHVECFLLRPDADPAHGSANEAWRCLLKPGRKLPVGERFADPRGEFAAEVVARHADGSGTVRFEVPSKESVVALAGRIGHVPLPPYIDRNDEPGDRERYQTVYANRDRAVAVAAPTAGLHFTPDLLMQIGKRGVDFADLTLHVGLGTFKPIATDTIEEHPIHRELYEIPPATEVALASGRRRIAVGTTSVRAIEDFIRSSDHPSIRPSGAGAAQAPALRSSDLREAEIFIYPPFEFRGVDALITNFHLPRSTLLCLVAAFLAPGSTDGIAWLKEIYAEAIKLRYRFLSYGDAMLIV